MNRYFIISSKNELVRAPRFENTACIVTAYTSLSGKSLLLVFDVFLSLSLVKDLHYKGINHSYNMIRALFLPE